MSGCPAATVLLYVEDEAITRELVTEVLTEAGFKLIVAADGAEALKIIEDTRQPLRGLITDITLGWGPNGFELARRARELTEGLPVVYMSGASSHEWNAQGVPHSVMITKPFAPAQIVVAIATLLNNADV